MVRVGFAREQKRPAVRDRHRRMLTTPRHGSWKVPYDIAILPDSPIDGLEYHLIVELWEPGVSSSCFCCFCCYHCIACPRLMTTPEVQTANGRILASSIQQVRAGVFL